VLHFRPMRPLPDDLKPRIEAFVGEQTGVPVFVRGIAPLAGGACQDNLLVDLEVTDGPERGDLRLVLRSDAAALLAGTLDRRREFPVIQSAVAAGVFTPPVRWLGHGVVREGAWAYFMDWAPGTAIGRKVLRDPDLAGARELLCGQLAEQLARIHSVLPPSRGGAAIEGLDEPAGGDAEAFALNQCREMLTDVGEPHPAIELAVRWLTEHRPHSPTLTLAHRDFRTGNFLVTPQGLSAILDWEFSGWGHPAEDLAWISVRDWRFGQLDRPIGGFAQREAFYEAYERAGGAAVDIGQVLWWEVMGNLRWGLGALLQGKRYLDGQSRDFELIAIARRAGEMEFEALRLIEHGF